MKLVIGLGNPGEKYEKTRHNAGFEAVDFLAGKLHVKVSRSECFAVLGGNKEVILSKPQTFMNLSGEAAVCLAKKFGAEPKDVIVVHDELDLPAGKIMVKFGGGSAGHKGINSIIEKLGTREFLRVRIGISPENKPHDAINFVLSKFSKEEREVFDASIVRASEAVEFLLSGTLEAAMNKYNG